VLSFLWFIGAAVGLLRRSEYTNHNALGEHCGGGTAGCARCARDPDLPVYRL